VAIPDNPNNWKQLLLEDAANGVVLVRIDASESLVTTGGMYRHTFVWDDEQANETIQTIGGGQVEVLPARPS
jgi:hypothetical protein